MIQLAAVDRYSVGVGSRSALPSGGTPAMALLYWWGQRYEAEGLAAVDALHDLPTCVPVPQSKAHSAQAGTSNRPAPAPGSRHE
jgi:hypothetical protein